MEEKYQYDVAISFSEKYRDAAQLLAVKLLQVGVKKVYYYPEHLIENVGWNLEEKLYAIYHKEARCAIALLSEEYFVSVFTRIELKAIRDRVSKSKEDVYLIPVLMDNTSLAEHPYLEKLFFLKWLHQPDTIVATVCHVLDIAPKTQISENLWMQAGEMKSLIDRATKDVTISYFRKIKARNFNFSVNVGQKNK